MMAALRANYRKWEYLIVILSVFAFIFSYFTFAPGFYSADSLSQYYQATGRTELNDWHPPIFAIVWAALIKITSLTSSMLVVQLLLIWAGVCLLALTIYKRYNSRLYSLLPFLTIGLSPYVFTISGTIWKDVHLAASLFFLSALSFYVLNQKNISRKKKIAVLAVTGALVIYASNIRYIAIIPTLPILILLSGLIVNTKYKYAYITSIIILVFAMPAVIRVAFEPIDSGVEQSVMLDDITALNTQDEIKRLNISNEMQAYIKDVVKGCEKTDAVAGKLLYCDVSPERFKNLALHQNNSLRDAWIKTLISDPVGYLEHRRIIFNKLLNPENIYAWHKGRVDNNEVGINPPSNKSTDLAEDHYNFIVRDYGFGFRPYFWFALSTTGLIIAYKYRRRIKMTKFIVTVYASGILLLLTYVPSAVSFQYRYTYWLTISSSLASTILVIELADINKKRIRARLK